jgi:LacI family transcriptional regulator
MEKKASLKDIAQKVGVSTALVSFVLSGKQKEKRVGSEVAKKIIETARELNYRPNQIARSLRKGSTMTIGLIVADISNPFFGQLARIIEDEADKYGYNVIFGSSDEDSKKSDKLGETLMNRQVDGFIIVPAAGTEEQITRLILEKIPVVLLDRHFTSIPCNYVVLDNLRASLEATEHMIRKGKRKIGIVTYDMSLNHMKDRIAGYRTAMQKQGLQDNISVFTVRFDHLYEDMENIFKEQVKTKKVEALYIVTNTLTIAALYCIQNFNIKIPDDLSVMGFDGNEAFDFFYCPVSYVEQPVKEMGAEAVSVLTGLMNGSEKTTMVKMKPRLIIRNSCG